MLRMRHREGEGKPALSPHTPSPGREAGEVGSPQTQSAHSRFLMSGISDLQQVIGEQPSCREQLTAFSNKKRETTVKVPLDDS